MLSPRESHGSLRTDRSVTSDPSRALKKRYRDFGYELGEALGRGRTGVVHRAVHASTGIPVAIKRLHAVDAEGLHDLKREFRTLFGGEHRGIAKVYELVANPAEPFFAMELIDGPELVSWVRGGVDAQNPDDAILARVIDAVTQLTTTLGWLHQSGRVHRDVKPSNVRVQDGRVVLLDFDLAALVVGAHRDVHDLAGTLAYMPNEALWRGETTTSADVYALGVLAYECLMGERPFRSADPIRLHQEKDQGMPSFPRFVPAWLDTLLRRMTNAGSSERPTAAGVLAILRERTGVEAHADVTASMRVEQEDAVQRLVDAYHSRDVRTPSLLCVSGPQSAGKTRAVNGFLDRAKAESECQILEGRCLPSATVPFQGLDGIVDALAERLSRWEPQKAAGMVPRDVAYLLELFPIMARVTEFRDATSNVTTRGVAADRRFRGFAGLRSVLEALARRRPLIVVVDDVQWADGPSCRFWADMLAGRTPFVFVAAARHRDAFSALQLGEGALRLDLHLQSSGRGDDRTASLPNLSSGAEQLLRASSLAFVPIDLQTLGRVTGAKNPAIPVYELIQAGGLIHHMQLDPQMTISPRDEVIRRAIDKSLSTDARRALHRALAEALSGSEQDAYAVAAFWHWHAADEPAIARSFASKAGTRLMKQMAFERAAEVYQAALEGSEEEDALPLTQRLAEALAASGNGKSAAEAYARAATRAERGGEASQVIRELRRRSSEAFLRAGYIVEGNAMLDEMVPEFRRMPTSNAGLLLFLFKQRAQRVLGSRFVGLSANETAESCGRLDALWSATVGTVWADLPRSMYYQALHASLARHADDPVHQARAKATDGCYLAAISPRLFGRAAERLGSESLCIAEELGDPNLIALARSTWATTSLLRGDWATTIERCESIADWVENECSAAQWELTTAYLYCGWSLGFRGDLQAIEEFRTKVLQRGRAHDDRLALTCVSVGLPNLTWLGRGRPDLARAGTRDAMREWRSPSYSPLHFFALFGETLTDLYCGREIEARNRFEVETQTLRRSFLRHHPIVRPLLHYLNVKTALAAVQGSPTAQRAARLRRSARISGWRLRCERAPWSRALSHAARAIWDSMYGRPETVNRRLLLTEDAFRGADMGLYAEAARFQRALLSGAEPSSFSASVADPRAMARCLLPVAIR